MMEKSFTVIENKTRCRMWVGPQTPHSHSKNKAEKFTIYRKKSWRLDIENTPEEYKTEIEQELGTINTQGGNSEEIWKAL
jgi:hypothetical protein